MAISMIGDIVRKRSRLFFFIYWFPRSEGLSILTRDFRLVLPRLFRKFFAPSGGSRKERMSIWRFYIYILDDRRRSAPLLLSRAFTQYSLRLLRLSLQKKWIGLIEKELDFANWIEEKSSFFFFGIRRINEIWENWKAQRTKNKGPGDFFIHWIRRRTLSSLAFWILPRSGAFSSRSGGSKNDRRLRTIKKRDGGLPLTFSSFHF